MNQNSNHFYHLFKVKPYPLQVVYVNSLVCLCRRPSPEKFSCFGTLIGIIGFAEQKQPPSHDGVCVFQSSHVSLYIKITIKGILTESKT